MTLNVQQQALDGLRHVDELLVTELTEAGQVREQAMRFRTLLFDSMTWIEQQCFQLKALQLKTRREEANLMRVEIKERLPLVLFLDTEPAVDASGSMVCQLYAVLAPPIPGLLRQYTLTNSGNWRRTAFARDRAGTVAAKAVAVPSFTADMLLLEAVDLLKFASTMRFGWPDLAERAAMLTLDELRDRARNREQIAI